MYPNGRRASGDKPKKIKSNLTIDDSDDRQKKASAMPVFYVVNYEEGGYSVVSADDRLGPILATVEKGEDIEKQSELPGGLLLWMFSTKEQIQNIRKRKVSIKGSSSGRVNATKDRILSEVSPLLRTQWDQGCTFNDNTPACGSGGRCGHTLTGCVATAMAQVIRYWGMRNPSFRTPFLYDWSSMPVGSSPTDGGNSGSPEIARLMLDAGREVGTDYGCGSSGASRNDVAPALKSKFGFASANLREYRPFEVANSLRQGWPVILAGCSDSGEFLWWRWGKGSCHAWVCDGYQAIETTGNEVCYYDEYDSWYCYTPTVTYHRFWMNWGWGGSHNGWFTETYFGSDINHQPMPADYKSHRNEIVDIHP